MSQASQYLCDEATASLAALALRRAVARITQQEQAPWESGVGKRLATAISCAPEALQRAALTGCPDKLLATAPLEILRPALAARCLPVGDPRMARAS
jgi:hypothetical protein